MANGNWSGFYAGLAIGYSHADFQWRNTELDTGVVPASGGGISYSARVGYDVQLGNVMVIGGLLELGRTEIGATGIHSIFPQDSVHYRIGNHAVLAARFGPRVGDGLIYGKAGIAFGQLQTTYMNWAPTSYGSEILTGYNVGVGYEHAVNADWSLFAELNYLDFGFRHRDPLQANVRHKVKFDETSFKVGLLRRF